MMRIFGNARYGRFWIGFVKNKNIMPYRLFASKLLPNDGWEHFVQPLTDSPLVRTAS